MGRVTVRPPEGHDGHGDGPAHRTGRPGRVRTRSARGPRTGWTRVARTRPRPGRPATDRPPLPPTVPPIRPPGGARRPGRAGGETGIRGRYSLLPGSYPSPGEVQSRRRRNAMNAANLIVEGVVKPDGTLEVPQ